MHSCCPICEKESTLILHKGIEEINIRGEKIPVEIEYYRCQECGEEFENPQPGYDPLEIAYNEFRSRKGYVQPSEIRDFRKKLGITQTEFSQLLGIGIATLSRYENGALQDEAHDRVLRLGMDPDNLLKLIKNNPRALSSETRQELIQKIVQERQRVNWKDFLIDLYGNYESDLFCGYKRFDAEKLFQVIKFFCYPEGVYKTKLTKLLFYADFKHFKDYSVSITGSKYAHLPYGPVPDQFENWFTVLLNDDPSLVKEEVWWGDKPGEVFISNQSANISILSTSEIKILAQVKEKFDKFNAKNIKDFSHKEKGYQATQNGELISYEYAEDLQI